MHYRILNPSKYLGAADLGGVEPTHKILRVVLEEIEEDVPKGAAPSKKKKGLVWLEGQTKGWLLCVTTAKALATMFGDETERWAGRSVTLFADTVMSFGEMVPAVRVRGSPELASTLSYVVKRRKKSDTFNLVKTGNVQTKAAQPQKQAAPLTQAQQASRAAKLAISAAFDRHNVLAAERATFVQKVAGKTKGFDANDVALIETALAAEAAMSAPRDGEPPPPSDEDAPL